VRSGGISSAGRDRVAGAHLLDGLPDVVGGMTLHEDHLCGRSQMGQPFDTRSDVAGIIAGRDHHAHAGLPLLLARRPDHQPMGDAQLLQHRQVTEPAVGQGREQGYLPQQQAAMVSFEYIPAGQIQQVGNILGREPAFRRLALTEGFGVLEQGLSQPVVKTHH